MTGIDITYSSDEDITDIQQILNYNDYPTEDCDLLRNALIFGVAYEIMYIDEDKQQRFKVLDSRECIPIYWNDLNQELAAIVRYYEVDTTDNQKDYYIEVYTDEEILNYKSNSAFSQFNLVSVLPNYYKQVPINVFTLNKEEVSIFDCIMGLQDCYNTLLSSETDDFESFCDAYLVLKGVQIDEEEAKKMRSCRILDLGDGQSDADAHYLTKNISDTQIENMLKNINDTIHKIAQSPDFSQESFGTSSGIALRFRLLGFENKAGAIEKQMTKALQRRIELICAILGLVSNITWRDIQIKFTRNIPIDMNDILNTVNGLRGLVSDKTLLAQIPFIQDVDIELNAIEEQKQKSTNIYDFEMKAEENVLG